MATITTASHEWRTRKDDERYTSLLDMQAHFNRLRKVSKQTVVSTHQINTFPLPDHKGIEVRGPTGAGYAPTHWAFGQLAAQAGGAPAHYLRTLPAPIAADCINYGLRFKRDTADDVGILLEKDTAPMLRAATGPKYGRIWNSDVMDVLVDRFGDGVSGDWRVPGEFGKEVVVNKSNTTLYASDRDFFVFLADEKRRIDVPNRRNGKAGAMARGFFMWNSEVGAATFGIARFLFDFVCMNRIIWGAEGYVELKIRHTASAPDRYVDEVLPALNTYANSTDHDITKAIADARAHKLGDDLQDFLSKRFGKNMALSMQDVHRIEEGRPIETRWDVVVAATAVARGIPHQDDRVLVERKAGALLTTAA